LFCPQNVTSTIKSRRIRWARLVAHRRKMRKSLKMLVIKPDGKSPFGRRRRRCKDNVNMGSRIENMYWIHMVREKDRRQDFVNMVMNLRIL
jgi:hypothetical protein